MLQHYRGGRKHADESKLSDVIGPQNADQLLVPLDLADENVRKLVQEPVAVFLATLKGRTAPPTNDSVLEAAKSITDFRIDYINNKNRRTLHNLYVDAEMSKYFEPTSADGLKEDLLHQCELGWAFHGTPFSKLQSIAENGLVGDKSKGVCLYGRGGVYYSTTAAYCHEMGFAQPTEGQDVDTNFILVCRAFSGRTTKGDKGMDRAPALPADFADGAALSNMHYNAVHGGAGDDKCVRCTFKDTAILPEFVFYYNTGA